MSDHKVPSTLEETEAQRDCVNRWVVAKEGPELTSLNVQTVAIH